MIIQHVLMMMNALLLKEFVNMETVSIFQELSDVNAIQVFFFVELVLCPAISLFNLIESQT